MLKILMQQQNQRKALYDEKLLHIDGLYVDFSLANDANKSTSICMENSLFQAMQLVDFFFLLYDVHNHATMAIIFNRLKKRTALQVNR